MPLETVAPQRKGCAVTRSFGQRITAQIEMEQAVASYADRLGEKLRRHGLATNHLTVFMHTSPFEDDAPQRSVSMTVDIPEATNDSLELIKTARRAVERLWQPGFRYAKAGIVTKDLVAPPIRQRALFDNLDHDRAAKVMAAMDEANARFGRGTIIPAAIGTKVHWATKFERRSPRYTTRWDELPNVG